MKLGGPCWDVSELQRMGISIVVVDGPVLEWGALGISEMINLNI